MFFIVSLSIYMMMFEIVKITLQKLLNKKICITTQDKKNLYIDY